MVSMLVILIYMVSRGRKAWLYDQSVPSSCSTTMTSIAPLSVAGLMEFHVLDTEPPILLTYCISLDDSKSCKGLRD